MNTGWVHFEILTVIIELNVESWSFVKYNLSIPIGPSPFTIKVETFLRINKIDFISDFKNFMGSKGKSPWITDTDGRALADSQLIIEHLSRKNNIQMLELTPEQEWIR